MSYAAVLGQIAIIDIIFSLDSVITAVGMVDQIGVMVAAVVIASHALAGNYSPDVLRYGLLTLPAVGAGLVAGLALSVAVLVVVQVIRRAGNYAIMRPAREMLYVVLGKEEKYKAKNFIDTVVYRGGDALSAKVLGTLTGTLGLGFQSLNLLALPLIALWGTAAIVVTHDERITDYCDQNELTTDKRLELFVSVCQAVQHAHQKGIIHRDIKAANVMYDPDTGQLKITDFGIARLTDSRRTKTGMVLGTPSSMSPEQLRGKKLDGRTDLYSLGVLMFQLLTGRLPYKAESLTQLMYKITNEPPPDLFVLRPDLKENGACIREIINKLLQKDADDRYQDGKKLARDLLACAKKMAGKK